MKIQIGSTIKTLRIQKKISQRQLAEALGVTVQAISKWENATCYPDLEHRNRWLIFSMSRSTRYLAQFKSNSHKVPFPSGTFIFSQRLINKEEFPKEKTHEN